MSEVAELERFRAIVSRRLGLELDESKLPMLAELLRREAPTGAARYLDALDAEPSRGRLRRLVAELTVPETYFFRHAEQFRAFSDVAARLAGKAPDGRLRVLSAGCASGEEPYTLAILVRELVPQAGHASILAVDVNPTVLEKAAAGRYSSWALRETTPEMREKWFRAVGSGFELDESLRGSVRFEERNLVAPDLDLFAPGIYDVVFCRNVLMYLTAARAREVVRNIARALVPGGYLFLGHAETLRGVSSDFHLRQTHNAFYYERKGALEPPPHALEISFQTGPGVPVVETTWVDAIGAATERIRVLADKPMGAGTAAAVPRPDLARALGLVEEERFAAALEVVGPLSADPTRDPDVLLLHAALLTHSGELAAAEAECQKLLEVDELNAPAHYLLALCREGAGDAQGAIDHDRAAAYLDPSFAMPRLHLGLMARRRGDRETARNELDHALSLLQREDAARLLLFGGGFGREALVGLCRAEIVAAGGRP